ncbi:hypothetical protein [Streptomyces eurythermus]
MSVPCFPISGVAARITNSHHWSSASDSGSVTSTHPHGYCFLGPWTAAVQHSRINAACSGFSKDRSSTAFAVFVTAVDSSPLGRGLPRRTRRRIAYFMATLRIRRLRFRDQAAACFPPRTAAS